MNPENVQLNIVPEEWPLRQTKLLMPKANLDHIKRSHLWRQLDTAVPAASHFQRRLTVVTGALGYGKTSLIVDWLTQGGIHVTEERVHTVSRRKNGRTTIRQRELTPISSPTQYPFQDTIRPTAWLTLDEEDNDPIRFLTYFFATVTAVYPQLGEKYVNRLITEARYLDFNAILTDFLQEIALSHTLLIVVLDDYHHIAHDTVHHIVDFILQQMSAYLHLIILTETEPPLVIDIMERGLYLNRIQPEQLRFAAEETSVYLQKVSLVPRIMDKIIRWDPQLAGWSADWQLIALCLKQKIPLLAMVMNGRYSLITQLVDQLFDSLPAETQNVLLQTAVLTDWNSRLCHHMVGQPCQLDALPFLSKLDANGEWCRYHPLFADYLNRRLRQEKTDDEIRQLHRHAAVWLSRNGAQITAVSHTLAAQATDLTANILPAIAPTLSDFSAGYIVRNWIGQIPVEQQVENPHLLLLHIETLLFDCHLSRAAQLLADCAAYLSTADLWQRWRQLRARLYTIAGSSGSWVQLAHNGQHQLLEEDVIGQSERALWGGLAQLEVGDIESAQLFFAELAQSGADRTAVLATYYWGQTYELQGEAKKAFTIYKQGWEKAKKAGNIRASGYLRLGMGQLYYQWHQQTKAQTHLRQARKMAQKEGDDALYRKSSEAYAHLLFTVGDFDGANRTILELEQKTNSQTLSWLRASIALRLGDWEPVNQWVKSLNLALEELQPQQVRAWPRAYILLARYHILKHDELGKLPRLLDVLEQSALKQRSHPLTATVRWLYALTYIKRPEISEGYEHFSAALELCQAGGFVRMFVDYPDPSLPRLFERGIERGGETAVYAQTLLNHLDRTQLPPEIPPFSRPPTPKEIEVLELLVARYSTTEMAEALSVGVPTLNSYLRRLYAKLGVHSREHAALLAQEYDLVGRGI